MMSETAIRPLVAGNWKMNGTTAALREPRLLGAMLKGVKLKCDVLVCPPATILRRAKAVMKGGKIKVGGQDCHAAASGAHTGDISAEMLKDAGASMVIVGHSERRTNHKETDAMVQAKAAAAHRAGLVAIICIGETLDERKGGKTLEVLSTQLKGSIPAGSNSANTVIAYEPVWAIGTGLTASPEQAQDACEFIRNLLRSRDPHKAELVRILYGGSVKPANAEELLALPDIDGALVGGAALDPDDFGAIVAAAPAA
mgnify:CR=1 FL=1